MHWGILIGSSKNDGRTSDEALARSCLKASPFAAKHPALKKWSSVSEGAAS